jgi:hypothetical protein
MFRVDSYKITAISLYQASLPEDQYLPSESQEPHIQFITFCLMEFVSISSFLNTLTSNIFEGFVSSLYIWYFSLHYYYEHEIIKINFMKVRHILLAGRCKTQVVDTVNT